MSSELKLRYPASSFSVVTVRDATLDFNKQKGRFEEIFGISESSTPS